MEFEDEVTLLRHVEAQHPLAYAHPPYLNADRDVPRQLSIVRNQKGAS